MLEEQYENGLSQYHDSQDNVNLRDYVPEMLTKLFPYRAVYGNRSKQMFKENATTIIRITQEEIDDFSDLQVDNNGSKYMEILKVTSDNVKFTSAAGTDKFEKEIRRVKTLNVITNNYIETDTTRPDYYTIGKPFDQAEYIAGNQVVYYGSSFKLAQENELQYLLEDNDYQIEEQNKIADITLEDVSVQEEGMNKSKIYFTLNTNLFKNNSIIYNDSKSKEIRYVLTKNVVNGVDTVFDDFEIKDFGKHIFTYIELLNPQPRWPGGVIRPLTYGVEFIINEDNKFVLLKYNANQINPEYPSGKIAINMSYLPRVKKNGVKIRVNKGAIIQSIKGKGEIQNQQWQDINIISRNKVMPIKMIPKQIEERLIMKSDWFDQDLHMSYDVASNFLGNGAKLQNVRIKDNTSVVNEKIEQSKITFGGTIPTSTVPGFTVPKFGVINDGLQIKIDLTGIMPTQKIPSKNIHNLLFTTTCANRKLEIFCQDADADYDLAYSYIRLYINDSLVKEYTNCVVLNTEDNPQSVEMEIGGNLFKLIDSMFFNLSATDLVNNTFGEPQSYVLFNVEKDLFLNDYPEDVKLIEDMILLTFCEKDNWSKAERYTAEDERNKIGVEGKIKSTFRVGHGAWVASVFADKKISEINDMLFNAHQEKYPSFRKNHFRYTTVKSIIAALSRYISSNTYTFGGGNSELNGLISPWFLELNVAWKIDYLNHKRVETQELYKDATGAFKPKIVTSFLLPGVNYTGSGNEGDPAETTRFQGYSELIWNVNSSFFKTNFGDSYDFDPKVNINPISDLDFSNIKVLRTENKVDLPELPSNISPINKSDVAGDAKGNDEDFSFVGFMPLSNDKEMVNILSPIVTDIQKYSGESVVIPANTSLAGISLNLLRNIESQYGAGKTTATKELVDANVKRFVAHNWKLTLVDEEVGFFSISRIITVILTRENGQRSTIYRSRVSKNWNYNFTAPAGIDGNSYLVFLEIARMNFIKRLLRDLFNYEVEMIGLLNLQETFDKGSVFKYDLEIYNEMSKEFQIQLLENALLPSFYNNFTNRNYFNKIEWDAFLISKKVDLNETFEYNLTFNEEFDVQSLEEISINSFWGDKFELISESETITIDAINKSDETVGVQKILIY